MKLYLVQHGEAVSKEIDPERPLSATGRSDVERLASFLGERSIQVARVVHSGKTRAQQTAELLATVVAPGGEVETTSGLKPLDSPGPCAFKLEEHPEDLLIVGHMPFLGKLVACLITEREDIEMVAFRPGTLACLERGEEGSWVIAWMVRPELLLD